MVKDAQAKTSGRKFVPSGIEYNGYGLGGYAGNGDASCAVVGTRKQAGYGSASTFGAVARESAENGYEDVLRVMPGPMVRHSTVRWAEKRVGRQSKTVHWELSSLRREGIPSSEQKNSSGEQQLKLGAHNTSCGGRKNTVRR